MGGPRADGQLLKNPPSPSGSLFTNGTCVVFNIGGHKYRLLARILYPSQKVFILRIMTHVEYDEDSWKKDCGCYETGPNKPHASGKPDTAKPQKRGK